MLSLILARLKHNIGYCLLLDLRADCDPLKYGYSDLAFSEPLVLLGHAENIAGEIQVTGRLSAVLSFHCSRCGAAFAWPITVPFYEIYSSQEAAPDEAGEQDKQVFSGSSIDLTPEALRALFAELPMKPLCHEDCQGLCPLCGVDLNFGRCSCEAKEIDPRWEALRGLLNDEAGKGV